RAWVKWEKVHPQSPLIGEARLAEAWNALRRGDSGGADHALSTVPSRAPWMKTDGRVTLARAAALYVEGRPADALALLGPNPSGAVFLAGDADSSLALFRGLTERYIGGDVAARAQFLVGEALVAQGKPELAIVEYNRVLTTYFRHSVAASAQYRVARCLDALG